MLFVPIVGFILFNFIVYPLQPHCDLGKGLLGCTPYCVKIGSSTYEKVPCFHNKPSKIQTYSFRNPITYYSTLLLPLIVLFIYLGTRRFYTILIRIAFYPIFLLKGTRKQKIIPRIITTILIFPTIIEWSIGYIVFAETILGIDLLG